MNRAKKEGFPEDEQGPRDVDFYIINADFGCEAVKSPRNTGTLIDLDDSMMGMMTSIPLQPGNIVELEHGGQSKYGVVMWSVESADNFRIQVRFV